MEWTKIPTTLITKRFTDYELACIVKFQLVWAMNEEEPDKKTALRYMTAKQYDVAMTYRDSVLSTVVNEVSSVVKKRNAEKIRYNKNKDLQEILHPDCKQSDAQSVGADKIREDKIKETNKEKTTMSPLFEECWSIYPKRRRESKSKVYPVWCKIIKNKDNHLTEEYMLDSVKRYANSEEATKEDGQFAKGFIAWLKGGCYSYEYKQASGVVVKNEVDMASEEYHQKLLKEKRPDDEVVFLDGVWQILPF